ncbi:MAG: hypothetical protein AVDCRST_MAG16-2111, partial [uncultured Frankineae bacterium]
ARGRALRRRRQLAAAGGAGTTLALVAAAVLALPTGERSTDSLVASAPPSPSATSSPVPSPPPSPTAGPTRVPQPVAPSPTDEPVATDAPPSPTPSPPGGSSSTAGQIELRGDDLAVTQIGAPREQAVHAVTAVLGAPAEDPSSVTRCVASMAEVSWPELTLAFDEQGRLSGWLSQSPSLSTPSGVTAGTTVAQLREVYGDRLTLHPPNPDNGDTYTVEGVSMVGGLSGSADADRVVSLANGGCTGP